MLGKRIINTGAGAACTTDTVQILDGTPFDSIATYELESDASNSIKSGYIGNGAIFNGSSSYVDTGISSLSGAFSVSLWINEISLSSGSVFGNWNSTSADDIYIRTNSSGQLRLGVDGISNQFFGSSGDISVNTWHHIVMTFNNGTVEAYLDGDSLGTSTTSNTSFSSGLNFVIGADSTKSNASHFNGTIDEVRIYNTALTAGNVATLYAETASSTISISGLQAHYKFEGDATDETGNYDGTAYIVTYNEYDGTASNVTYATGKFGNAAVFNGSSSYIDTTYTVPAVSTQSISVWFKTTSTGSYRTIFSDAPSNGAAVNTRMQIYTTPTSTYDIIIGNNSSYWIGTGSSISSYIDGNWHNIIATYNGTDVKVYIDGSLFQSFTSTISFGTAGNQSLVLGKAGLNNVNYWNGSLDQVRIYDKAISAADVATLYAETLATSQTNISLNAPSGVAYYKMNDATDETGSYDGTATNVNFNVAGKFGNAGEFNGSSSKIDLPFNLQNTAFSVSFWAKNTLDSNNYYLIANNSGSAQSGWHIGGANSSGTVYNFRINNGSSNYLLLDSGTVDDSDWHHVVVTWDNTTNTNGAKIYINGSLSSQGTSTSSTNFSFTNSTIQLMAEPGGSLRSNGSIDQVRIFDRAITSDEVTTLYNEVYCQPTIVPTDYFEPVLYTGGSQQVISLAFEPDFLWIKSRGGAYNHLLFDSVRGIDLPNDYYLQSNTTAGQVTTVDRFSLNGNSITIPVGSNVINSSAGSPYIMWNWKAGGTAVPNTDGTTTSYVSANQDAGFSIVKHGGSNTITVGHGLSQAPELIIQKRIDGSTNWIVHVASLGYTHRLQLNTTDSKLSNGIFTNVNSSTFSFLWSSNSYEYINYCFHSVEGMSKIGSYTGTGASGNSIVTGFRPAFVMVKPTSTADNWLIYDNKRGDDTALFANLSNGDTTYTDRLNLNSNGFTLDTNNAGWNGSNQTYIFLAFAEENTQPEPVLANSFNVVTYTGNGSTQAVTGLGFQPDLLWVKNRDQPDNHRLVDSIRGATNYIIPNLTNTQTNSSANVSSLDSDGFTVGTALSTNTNNEDYVAWAWKASNDSTINTNGSISSIVSANPAAGFSVVKYTGNLTASTVGHGLSSAPEFIIVKKTDSISNWFVYSEPEGNTKYLNLDRTAASATFNIWNNTNPTDTVFSLAAQGDVNASGGSYIAYCFNSVDGYQKVGSYSGSSSNVTVTTGFRPRWVMVKSTTSAHSWYVIDSARGATSSSSIGLFPNLSNAEASGYGIYFEDNGFVVSSGVGTGTNASGNTYIYLAIA